MPWLSKRQARWGHSLAGRNGMFATNAQLTAAAKTLRDRFFTAKKNSPLPLSIA
ncbi:MAG TPA: hypothetical protein VHV32_19330 [Candidatus Angelobacter sp.]|jgi:hypothetical protein|nr:hypothetical protein [Candidatus Angelobacter sp.]